MWQIHSNLIQKWWIFNSKSPTSTLTLAAFLAASGVIIIVDWDDTIFPTSWIQNKEHGSSAPGSCCEASKWAGVSWMVVHVIDWCLGYLWIGYIYILGWCWRYHDGDGDDGLWTNECSRGVRSRFSGNGSTGWMVQITTNYDRLLGATNHKFYLLSRNRTYNWYMMICVFNRSPKFYQFIARILLFFLAGYVCICNTMYDICIHNMQTFAYITYIIIYICNVCNVCNMMHYIYIYLCIYI